MPIKELYATGVGKVMVTANNGPNNQARMLIKGQKPAAMSINLKVDLADIRGGESLMPVMVFPKQADCNIAVENLGFDPDNLSALAGNQTVRNKSGSIRWVMGESITVAAAATPVPTVTVNLAQKAAYFVGSPVIVRYADGTTLPAGLTDANLTLTSVAPTAIGQVQNGNNGTLTFYCGSGGTTGDVGNTVQVWYQMTDSTQDQLDIAASPSLPVCQFAWKGKWRQPDGTIGGIQVDVYACVPYGDWKLDAKYMAHNNIPLSFRAIDPQRSDGAMGSVKLFTPAANEV